jgi:hypothetical protein
MQGVPKRVFFSPKTGHYEENCIPFIKLQFSTIHYCQPQPYSFNSVYVLSGSILHLIGLSFIGLLICICVSSGTVLLAVGCCLEMFCPHGL